MLLPACAGTLILSGFFESKILPSGRAFSEQ